ncbi:Exopolyphosphatase [Tilletia horrida]|uniref:Exopolyphosphatase n=1 Tax=Tilletia horrida TaxID=155126 RepID=A0AAN6G7V7_9BASI|nr:Exopolyphosphatase [Tilletia horrida]
MATANTTPEPLNVFLRRTRSAALEYMRKCAPGAGEAAAAAADNSRAHEHLTLIMGNEAGDLDSLASSVALAYLFTHLPHPQLDAHARASTIYAPLIQTAAADLYLRPENEAISRFAGISTALDGSTGGSTCDLLTIDALEGGAGSVSDALGMDLAADGRLEAGAGKVSFGLVDHPALIPRWGDHEKRDVRYIVDHHKDEGAHPQAKIRFMRGPGSVPDGEAPIGSAASMIVEVFQDELLKTAAQPAGAVIPKAVADLLISAIVIDTDNLRPVPRGRATPRDVLSHAILLPLSSFAPGPGGDASLNGEGKRDGEGLQNGGGRGTCDGTGPQKSSSLAGAPASKPDSPTFPCGGAGAGPTDSSGNTKHSFSDEDGDVDHHMHCDVEEPVIFDVEMELPTPSKVCCPQAAHQKPSKPQETNSKPPLHHQHADFKARCDSEASTAGACHGGGTRPSIPVDPAAAGGQAVEEEEDNEEDDVMEEMAGRDLYKILGLKRGVDQGAIRTAYRREALKCHPDRARSLRDAERRTRRFKLLVNAYEILSDPIKRRQYALFYDPLTSGVGSGASTPGGGGGGGGASYASSSFSYSYSSSYNTSSSFFDNYGSSFSSTSYFSTSPPPQGGFAGAASSWKFESYEQLKAEELARTETRTVADSLFAKRPHPSKTHSSAAEAMEATVSCLAKERPKVAADVEAFSSTTAAEATPPAETVVVTPMSSAPPKLPTAAPASVPTTAAVATATTTAPTAPRIAPTPQKFSFVWESPAESLRRARARPGFGGPASGRPAGMGGVAVAMLSTGGTGASAGKGIAATRAVNE